jgi:thymidine kinase
VACFKPDLDVRYHRTAIASHSAQTLEAVTVANVEEMKGVLMPMLDDIEVIGVDEAQFLNESLVGLANELVHLGKRVILAGLDTTFAGRPFAPIPELLAIADEVIKLSAVCMQCGAPAIHTQRLGSNQALVGRGCGGGVRGAVPGVLSAVGRRALVGADGTAGQQRRLRQGPRAR